MKFWDLIRTANSNLWRNKLRTTLTIIAIFVGGFVITLMVGLNTGVNDYIDQQLGSIGGDNLIMAMAQQEYSDPFSTDVKEYDPEAAAKAANGLTMLTEDDIKKIKEADSRIEFVTPNLMPTAEWVSGTNGKKYVLNVDQNITGIDMAMTSGKMPTQKTNDAELAISSSVVKTFGFSSNEEAIGETLQFGVSRPDGTIEVVEGKISGISAESLVNSSSSVFVNYPLAKKIQEISMSGMQIDTNVYAQTSIIVKKGTSVDELGEIRKNIEDAGYIAVSIRDQITSVTSVVDAITGVLIGFGAIALLAASFGIINTLFMSVQERTREIGLMKAMGMSRSRVFALFSFEAILIGFWGSIVSITVAIITGILISNFASDTLLSGFDGFILMKFTFAPVFMVMIVVMSIAFFAGTLPARRASKKDPIEALRYE